MQPEDFKERFDVSRETFAKLQTYHGLLLKWQKAINLVGPKTVQDSWSRHFADSAQLLPFIPEDTKTITDLGSGAGFPGLVLAIMRPELEVHLVESDERKAQFLRTVSRETNAGVIIHNERIEDLPGLTVDLITARALADLKSLLGYCQPWLSGNPDLKMLFLKGQNAQAEIEEAKTVFDFSIASHASQTAREPRILFISDVKPL